MFKCNKNTLWQGLQVFATPVQPTPANTLDYTTTDATGGTNFGKLLEPGLRKIFFETYDEIPEQYSKVYNILSSKKAVERDWGMGAFGDWAQRTSHLDEVDYQTISPGDERIYIHNGFTSGFMIAREMYDDEAYGQIKKMPKALARAGRAKVEKDAATVFVTGFSANGYDGVPLFSNTHPLLDSASTVPNRITGALTDVNLKDAMKVMHETLDEAGNLIQMKPTKLIIPPALEDTARRLLHSALLPGTADNDTNEYLRSSGIQICVNDYLSAAAGGSDTAWFLQDGSRHELNFFWRVHPEFKWEEDFDTFVSKYRGYMRYSYGYSDWRGLVGSTGV